MITNVLNLLIYLIFIIIKIEIVLNRRYKTKQSNTFYEEYVKTIIELEYQQTPSPHIYKYPRTPFSVVLTQTYTHLYTTDTVA